jgi:hypothetical protein
MRKVIIFNLLALFVASAAFAAPGAQSQADFTIGTTGLSLWGANGAPAFTGNAPNAGTILIGKNSTGCSTGWDTANGGYALNTQHQNGSKAFGTSYDSTAIYQTDVVKGTAVAQPGATDSSAFGTGWTTM